MNEGVRGWKEATIFTTLKSHLHEPKREVWMKVKNLNFAYIAGGKEKTARSLLVSSLFERQGP